LTVLSGFIIAFIHSLCNFFDEGGGNNVLARRLLQLILISIPLTVIITVYIIKNESRLNDFPHHPCNNNAQPPPPITKKPTKSSEEPEEPEEHDSEDDLE
jgi:hypothetical protein